MPLSVNKSKACSRCKSRLTKDDDFCPLVYERKASAISVGGPDYTLFEASGEFDGHIINEVKVMVPCREVVSAGRVLKKLDAKPRVRNHSKAGRSRR